MSSFGPNHHAASAWLALKTESSNSVLDSFNISSNTDNANGDFSISYSNNFSNNDYSTAGTASPGSSTNPYVLNPNRVASNGLTSTPATSSQRLNTTVANGGDDTNQANLVNFGDIT